MHVNRERKHHNQPIYEVNTINNKSIYKPGFKLIRETQSRFIQETHN